MKNFALVLLGLFLGVGVTGVGQNRSGIDKQAGILRKVAPQNVPEAMRPFLPDASEIQIGDFLVVHGGPADNQRLCVFPKSKNNFPVMLVESGPGESFRINMQDSRENVFTMRDRNGDGAADGYDVSIIHGDTRVTNFDRDMNGDWDFTTREKRVGSAWSTPEAKIRYKGEWLPYLLIDGKPAMKTKEGVKRIEVKNGVVEIQ